MAISVHRAALQDTTAIARIHVDAWRTTYKGIMTDEFLSNLSYERRQRVVKMRISVMKRDCITISNGG